MSIRYSVGNLRQEDKQVQLITYIETSVQYKAQLTSGGYPCLLDVALLCRPIESRKDPEVSQVCLVYSTLRRHLPLATRQDHPLSPNSSVKCPRFSGFFPDKRFRCPKKPKKLFLLLQQKCSVFFHISVLFHFCDRL